jgi:ethanolamine utilization cobalamin adenosyltransferase
MSKRSQEVKMYASSRMVRIFETVLFDVFIFSDYSVYRWKVKVKVSHLAVTVILLLTGLKFVGDQPSKL